MLANPIARQRVHSSPLYKDAHQPSCARIPQRGSVWIVQALSTNKLIYPDIFKSHSAAACGSFKSFLLASASTRSSPIPYRGSVWSVQVLSTNKLIYPDIFKSHIAAAWGPFKSFLLTSPSILISSNPTSRQRGVRSSPFY